MKDKKSFHTKSAFAHERIGPHNIDVISVLVGSLLGDGYAEKRNESTRFQIHMSSKNMEYLSWLHKFFAERGYSSPKKATVKKVIGKKNQIYFTLKFKTYSFKSLNFLFETFYDKKKKVLKKKHIPSLLTEKALAVWIMDRAVAQHCGGKSYSSIKIFTESFSQEDLILLQKTLSERYNIKPSIQHHKDKTLLYFKKSICKTLFSLLKPHILPCMYYKFTMEKSIL